MEVTNVKSMKMLKSGVLKTIRTCKNKIKKENNLKTFAQIESRCTLRLGLSALIKKHLIDEAVKFAVAFFEYCKIRSEIFRCRRIFVTEMLANRRRSVSMFVHALM